MARRCHCTGRGEFDESGNRFDLQTSRFAQVIDAHDTMVYCSTKAHKCIFSSLNGETVVAGTRQEPGSYDGKYKRGFSVNS